MIPPPRGIEHTVKRQEGASDLVVEHALLQPGPNKLRSTLARCYDAINMFGGTALDNPNQNTAPRATTP